MYDDEKGRRKKSGSIPIDGAENIILGTSVCEAAPVARKGRHDEDPSSLLSQIWGPFAGVACCRNGFEGFWKVARQETASPKVEANEH